MRARVDRKIMQENLPLNCLVCPQNHAPLRVAEAALLERVNEAIAAGRLTNHGGRRLGQPIEGGLVRDDGRLLYPIVDEIPILLADEAISLDPL